MPCMGVPVRLGRYAVRRRLGSGGFATVWLAYDEQLDAEVAVKVLADNWGDDESVRRRFLEEGRFLRRVESEHVVQVHDVGELEDGRPFLVLTYADRGTLADRIREKPLELAAAVDVVVQVGRGLQALHRRGLLHRDVKPANVLFRSTDDDGERAVLSDLGLGKSLDEVSRITIPGGTPSYVAPEQAMGERLDPRADQYSLGAVAYAALTGQSPHKVNGLRAAGQVEAPPRPSELGVAVPDRIEDAILRALEPDRENRWPDVGSFTRELVGGLNETTRSLEAIPAVEPVRVDPAAVTQLAAPAVAVSAPRIAPAVQTMPAVPAPRTTRGDGWLAAAVIAALLGGGGGYLADQYVAANRLVQVGTGPIAVRVPSDWSAFVSTSNWIPNGSTQQQPAVRASTENDWSDAGAAGEGVFAGLVPGTKLPSSVKHDECSKPTTPTTSRSGGYSTMTQWFSGCGEAGAIVVERWTVVSANSSLMIQIRAADLDEAQRVLNTVSYTG
jgi:hypothetical protein